MSREMKHSGIEWIGEIPKGWKTCYTSSLFHEHKEKNIGLKNTNLLSLSYGKIKQKDINTNEGLLPQSFETYNVIRKGDIVFRLTDLQNDKRSLRTGLCKEDGIITSAYVTLRANAEVDSAYFHFLFHSYDECKVFYGLGDGVRQGMNWADVRKLSVILPPLLEQQKIAEYLDKVCGEVDELVVLQEKMIEELKAYKQSVITEAVTKGLNPNAPMKDSGIDWIGEVPEGWRICRLKFFCKYIKDGTHFSPTTVSEGYPYITATDVRGVGIDYSCAKRITRETFLDLKKAGCQPHKGDVLLVKDGATTGRVGMMVDDEECVLLSSVAMLSPNANILSSFLMYILMSSFMQSQIQLTMAGTALPRITLSKLVNFFGIFPPLSEQQAIASYLDSKCSEIDSLIAIKQQKIEELKDYKKSVIYEYVTGKKEVV